MRRLHASHLTPNQRNLTRSRDTPWKIAFSLKVWITLIAEFNPLTDKLFNWNFYPLQVVSRWRDPQLQVSENYSRFDKMEVNDFEILLVDVTFYLWYVLKLAFNVQDTQNKKGYNRDRRLKGCPVGLFFKQDILELEWTLSLFDWHIYLSPFNPKRTIYALFLTCGASIEMLTVLSRVPRWTFTLRTVQRIRVPFIQTAVWALTANFCNKQMPVMFTSI